MTSKQFQQFRKEFLKWQTRLGLQHYDIIFEQKPLPNTWAELAVDAENFVGILTLSECGTWTPDDIKKTACHESIHLLLAQYNNLAHSRFIRECEICGVEERVVRALERELWTK